MRIEKVGRGRVGKYELMELYIIFYDVYLFMVVSFVCYKTIDFCPPHLYFIYGEPFVKGVNDPYIEQTSYTISIHFTSVTYKEKDYFIWNYVHTGCKVN